MYKRSDEHEKERQEAPPTIPKEDEDLAECGKAFSTETARSQDEDEPCKDGVG
jgi:hypothetical protein